MHRFCKFIVNGEIEDLYHWSPEILNHEVPNRKLSVFNLFFQKFSQISNIFSFLNSTIDLWKTKIDAGHNYWGYNDTSAVGGRIKDIMDDTRLLEVKYEPFYMNNKTILNGKCPPGWGLVGDTCYIFIGAPMTFHEAKAFCIVSLFCSYSLP